MTTQSKSLRLADQLASHPYAWPGGYPLYGLTSDGATICNRCCRTERDSIATTTGSDGFQLVGICPNFEDPFLYCDHCGGRIESAYAEV